MPLSGHLIEQALVCVLKKEIERVYGIDSGCLLGAEITSINGGGARHQLLRLAPYLVPVFLGFLGLLFNKRSLVYASLARSYNLLTLDLEVDCSDCRTQY